MGISLGKEHDSLKLYKGEKSNPPWVYSYNGKSTNRVRDFRMTEDESKAFPHVKISKIEFTASVLMRRRFPAPPVQIKL